MLEPDTADQIKTAQAQLLQRIAAGDLPALSELYDQIAAPLFSVALRILGDSADAEEVVQDVFIQVWEKAATFDPDLGSAFHWALSITRHRSIDRLRARQRRSRLAEELQHTMTSESSTQLAPAAALAAGDTAAVRAALEALPDDQRQAIELAFLGGKTHLEIADLLRQPLGTIKARIRRGLLKLRESLQEYA